MAHGAKKTVPTQVVQRSRNTKVLWDSIVKKNWWPIAPANVDMEYKIIIVAEMRANGLWSSRADRLEVCNIQRAKKPVMHARP
mmetsp:Transcript_20403/g.42013  ORF Transcript_20403/g.42013 Transcript_20403/m.42013 type:complete len:83 (+) Transcript_20403:686-934(+)